MTTLKSKSYPITPVPKPRQTQQDKFKVRPRVARYRAFADEVRLRRVQLPEAGARVIFHMPMPKSWSKKKRAEMDGKPHQSRPDVDNLFKALADALYQDDSCIWNVSITKRWAVDGSIEILQSLRRFD